MNGRRGVLGNLGILAAAQVVTMLLSVAALVHVARTVGSHWFGVLQLGVAFSAYALLAAEWGLYALGIREVARLDSPARALAYARLHVGLLALLGAAALAAGALVLPLLPFFRADPAIFLLYLLTIVPQVFTLEWLATGLERMPWVGISRTARSLVYAVLILLLLRCLDGAAGWPAARWVPLLFLVSWTLSATLLAWRVRGWLGGAVLPTWRGRGELARRLRAAGAIGAGLIIMRAILNIDLLLLGVVALPEVVGGYAAAAKIIFVLPVAVEVLWGALLPRLSRLWRESEEQFRRRFTLYLGLAAAGFLPVAVGGWMVGPRLMQLLYGASFADAGRVFQVLSVSYVLLALGQFFGNTLLASDRQRVLLAPLGISAAVAAAAVLLLASRWGAPGASWGMLIAHATLLAGTAWTCRRLCGRALLRPFAFSLLGCGLMAAALRLGSAWPLPALVALGGVAYGAVALPLLLPWARRQR